MGAMQNLIIVEQQDFLRDMVELCLEEEDVEVIGLKDASDFEYLIKDIRPQVFIVDVKSIGDYKDRIIESYKNNHPEILFVFTGLQDEEDFLKNNSLDAPFLVKPLAPNGLKDTLETLIKNGGKLNG